MYRHIIWRYLKLFSLFLVIMVTVRLVSEILPIAVSAQSPCPSCVTKGQWSPRFDWPPGSPPPVGFVQAIHMHVLPNKKVLAWTAHPGGNHHLETDGVVIWNPETNTTETASPNYQSYDMFCSGHSFLADGRLLVTSGHWEGGYGLPFANLFDWRTKTWTAAKPFSSVVFPITDPSNPAQTYFPGGRWYPTNATLANGEILLIGGVVRPGEPNPTPQVYQLDGNWRTLSGATVGPGEGLINTYAYYYPFMHVAPNGKVFNAGPQKGARYLDTSGAGSWSSVVSWSSLSSEYPAGTIYEYVRSYGSSVVFQDTDSHIKVLNIGGGRFDLNFENGKNFEYIVPTNSAEIIDLSAANPQWQSGGNMQYARRHLNAVVLPTGQILAVGGTSGKECLNCCAPPAAGCAVDERAENSTLDGQKRDQQGSASVFVTELWDPGTKTWSQADSISTQRLYHSEAVLLADGRVLVAGGGTPNLYEEPPMPCGNCPHKDAQIYSPPYLFKPDGTLRLDSERPQITSAPDAVSYGRTFFVGTSGGGNQVTLARLSSVTHAYNQDQRLVRPNVTVVPGGLNVTVPANITLAGGGQSDGSNICPPGYYLLFVLNNGVPSKAKVVALDGFRSLGGTATSGPAAAGWGSDRVDVIVRGSDNDLYRGAYTPSIDQWGGFGGYGLNAVSPGGAAGKPAVTTIGSPASGRMDLFVRGANNGIYHNRQIAGQSPVWEVFPGATLSEPGAVAWGNDRIDVLVRGTDNEVYHGIYVIATNQFGGWAPLGLLAAFPSSGGAAGKPVVVSTGSCCNGRIELFVRGADNGFYHKSVVNGLWGPWVKRDGALISDPAATAWGSDRIDIFVNGTDNDLYQATFLPGTSQWNGFGSYGFKARITAGASGTPAVVSYGTSSAGQMNVYVRGADNARYHRGAINASVVTDWELLGTGNTSDPAAFSGAANNLNLFATGTAGDPRQKRFDTKWRP